MASIPAALQKAVSIGAEYIGLIEIIELDAETCILCNEEGKLIGLTPNRRFCGDVLCGTFYVTGQTKDGDLDSLSEDAIHMYEKRFAVPETIPQEEAANALFARFIAWDGGESDGL